MDFDLLPTGTCDTISRNSETVQQRIVSGVALKNGDKQPSIEATLI
mgnify:CR=1 FL=1